MFRMKLKILTGIIAAGCLFANLAFGQALQITGRWRRTHALKLRCYAMGRLGRSNVRRAQRRTAHRPWEILSQWGV